MLGCLNRLFVVSALVFAAAACNNQTSSKMQSARMDAMKAQYGSHFTYMTDNAILHDIFNRPGVTNILHRVFRQDNQVGQLADLY